MLKEELFPETEQVFRQGLKICIRHGQAGMTEWMPVFAILYFCRVIILLFFRTLYRKSLAQEKKILYDKLEGIYSFAR